MRNTIRTIPDTLRKIPPFPPVAVKLMNLLSSQAVDSNEVADLIASDATFTARLLRRANSAQFGFASPVTDVRRAVTLLGLDVTRQVTLMHATAAYSRGSFKTENMRRSWQHSVATAVLADEIAAACGDFTSAAFTAGVMHDIGRLGLIAGFPDEYENVVRNAAQQSMDILIFEEERFGVHHAEVGRMLAEQWGLPSQLLLVAGRHHDRCEGNEVSLLRIVHVACLLADLLGYDVVKPFGEVSIQDALEELPEQARAQLRRDPKALAERIDERIREFGSEPTDAPPEETLALLASTIPSEQPPLIPAPQPVAAPLDFIDLEIPIEPPPARRGRAVMLWIGIAVTILAVTAALIFVYR